VHVDDIPSKLHFHDVPEEGWEIGPAQLKGFR
jgi:hypothetical protein